MYAIYIQATRIELTQNILNNFIIPTTKDQLNVFIESFASEFWQYVHLSNILKLLLSFLLAFHFPKKLKRIFFFLFWIFVHFLWIFFSFWYIYAFVVVYLSYWIMRVLLFIGFIWPNGMILVFIFVFFFTRLLQATVEREKASEIQCKNSAQIKNNLFVLSVLLEMCCRVKSE